MVVAQARHKKKPVKKRRSLAGAATASAERLGAPRPRPLDSAAHRRRGSSALSPRSAPSDRSAGRSPKGLAVAFGVGRFALPDHVARPGRWPWSRARSRSTALASCGAIALGLVSVCGIGDLAGGRPTLHATLTKFAHAGGWLGVLVGGGLDKAIGIAGALVVLLALLVVAIMVGTGIGLRALVAGTATLLRAVGSRLARWWSSRDRPDDVGRRATTSTRSRRRARVRAIAQRRARRSRPMLDGVDDESRSTTTSTSTTRSTDEEDEEPTSADARSTRPGR